MTNGALDPQDTFPGCPGRWAGKPLGWGAPLGKVHGACARRCPSPCPCKLKEASSETITFVDHQVLYL